MPYSRTVLVGDLKLNISNDNQYSLNCKSNSLKGLKEIGSVDKYFEKLIKEICKNLDKNAPEKYVLDSPKQKNSWITNSIKNKNTKRITIHQQLTKNPSSQCLMDKYLAKEKSKIIYSQSQTRF